MGNLAESQLRLAQETIGWSHVTQKHSTHSLLVIDLLLCMEVCKEIIIIMIKHDVVFIIIIM